MSWGVLPWVYPIWNSLCFLDLGDYFLPHFREVFNNYLLSKNRIASLCLKQDTACLGLVHGDDPERCYGQGGGGGFMFGIACTPVVDSCQCMAKPIQYCKVK